MRAIRTSGLMSGDGKRGGATAPVLAPILDSTKLRQPGIAVAASRGFKPPGPVITRFPALPPTAPWTPAGSDSCRCYLARPHLADRDFVQCRASEGLVRT